MLIREQPSTPAQQAGNASAIQPTRQPEKLHKLSG